MKVPATGSVATTSASPWRPQSARLTSCFQPFTSTVATVAGASTVTKGSVVV